MKIKINKNILEQILINCQNFIEKKDSSAITSHILMTSVNNVFTIKATDYEIGILIKNNEYEQINEGMASANGKKILDIIKSLKNENILLETQEDYLYIKQNKV